MWWVGGKSHRTAVPQKHSLRDWSPSSPSTNISCSLRLNAEGFLSFPTLWPHPALHQVLRCQPPRLIWTHGGVSGCRKDCRVTLAFSRLPCSSFQTGQRGSGSLCVWGSNAVALHYGVHVYEGANFFFLPMLLRYNWHTALTTFKVYSVKICLFYIMKLLPQ